MSTSVEPPYVSPHGIVAGTEAARAVLDHAFRALALDEVVSFTAAANLRSQRVMEKIGMHHDRS